MAALPLKSIQSVRVHGGNCFSSFQGVQVLLNHTWRGWGTDNTEQGFLSKDIP